MRYGTNVPELNKLTNAKFCNLESLPLLPLHYIYLFENVMDLCQNSRGHLISRFSSLSVSPIISSFGIISNSFTFLCSHVVDDIHNRKINNKKNNRLFYYFSLLSSSVVGHDS